MSGRVPRGDPVARWPVGPAWLVALVAAVMLAQAIRQQAGSRRRVGRVGLALAGLLLCIALHGCGSTSSPGTPAKGTPAGTYTITVTGTAAGVSHSIALTLIVS